MVELQAEGASENAAFKENPPAQLFKYRVIGRSLEQLLTAQEIYCSPASDFNDPFECRPVLRIDHESPEGKRWFNEQAMKYGVKSPAKRLQFKAQLARRYEGAQTVEDFGMGQLYEGIGIYSLTADPTNVLMWSHYADSHRGVCVEFDTRLYPFATAWKVSYSNEYPVIRRPQDDNLSVLRKSVLTKALNWQYEQEWRVVMRTPDAEELRSYENRTDLVAQWHRAQHGPGAYKIAKKAITGLILGLRIAESDRTKVADWAKAGGLDLKFKQAQRSNTEFRITAE